MPIDQFQIDKYSTDEDNLLEYVIKVADVIAPDIVFRKLKTKVRQLSLKR